MSLTIDLSTEQEAALQARASQQGVSAETYIQRILQQEISGRRRHISETIRANMQDAPPDLAAQLPSDGASQHDHYIYGLPKRES